MRVSLSLYVALSLVVLAGCGGKELVNLGDPRAQGAATDAGVATVTPSDTPGDPPDAPPVIETVLSGQTSPGRIAVGGDKLFFTSTEASDIERCNVHGKELVQLGLGAMPTTFAADGAGFYLASGTGLQGSALDGCSLQECDGFMPQFHVDSVSSPTAVALSPTHVVWATADGIFDTTVWRAPRMLGKKYEAPVEAVAEKVVSLKDVRPYTFELDGDELFIGEGSGELAKVDLGTKSVKRGYMDPVGPVKLDATHLYFVDRKDGLKRSPRNGKPAELVWAMSQVDLIGQNAGVAAVGQNHVYLTLERGEGAQAAGRVVRVHKSTKAVTTLVTDAAGLAFGAYSDGYFYWSASRSGMIQRVRD